MPRLCCRSLRLLVLVSILFAFATRANAQATVTNPPPGITQQEFSTLVEAISNAVVEKLKREGAVGLKPVEAAKSEPPGGPEAEDLGSDQAAAFVTRARLALTAFPELWRNLVRVPALLDKSASGSRGLFIFLVTIALSIAVARGSAALVRRAVNGIRLRLASRLTDTTDFWPLIALACLDVLGVAAVWLASYGLIGAWFPGSDEQARFAAAVLTGIFYWRLYMLAFRIFLRPALSAARLVKLADAGAWDFYWRVSAVILFFIALRIVFRILTAIRTPPEAISAWQVLASFLAIGVLLWVSWKSRPLVTTWFTGMIDATRLGGLESALARHWFPIAATLFFVLFLAQLYGAVTQRFTVATALLLTLNLLIGLVLFVTLLHFVKQRLAPVVVAVPVRPRAADLVARCIRVGVYIAVV